MRKGALPAAARNRSGSCHVHHAEPADVALAKARELAAGESDDDFCDECGRRLARACIHWSDWVVRRVEKVRFRDDRSVNRQISIDFLVREDAPVYQAPGGRRFWLVPVSVMRRKTLVNYSLRDEEGSSIHFPGLRLTQNLDESLLRAVASRELGDSLSKEAEAFIRDVITGELEQVQERMNSLANGRAPAEILRLSSEKKIFNILLHRLSFCYTLYAFIEADEGRRHRILHMSIDEPLTFYYREPELAADPEGGYADELSHPRDDIVPWWHKARLAAALGWVPTKVRFRVPAAENAASFHFEIEAPTGVDIVEASLVAGIPGGAAAGLGLLLTISACGCRPSVCTL